MPVQYSYTSTHPIGCTACTEPQCLYSTAIPLLPLCAVRPVQSLSACTVQPYLYSPYGLYGLYRASVPLQGCNLLYTFCRWQQGMPKRVCPLQTGSVVPIMLPLLCLQPLLVNYVGLINCRTQLSGGRCMLFIT